MIDQHEPSMNVRSPREVADAVRAITELGFDHLQLGMVTAGSPAALAPLLLDSP